MNQTRAQQLPAGTYTANVTIASPGAGNTPLTIPVTLTVTGTAGLLNVSTAAGNNTLTFNADLNGQVPANQTISVSSTDNTNQAFTISVDPATASWVLLGSRSGQTGTTGTFFNVGVSPSAVPAAGKQEADIVITPTTAAGTTPVPQKVHVVFNVNATTTVTATPARVEVTQAGTTGQAPAPVNVQLTSAVSGITFNASTQPSVSWLTVEPQSGTLNPTATIRLTFNTTGLAAGRHETVLRISPTGATEVSIPVTLTIANGQLNLSQAAFNVTHIQGTAAPANLTLGVTSSGTPITLTAAATSTGNWLSVTPTTATTGNAGAANTNLTLAINPTGLAAGTHTGTVTITSPGATNSPQTVTVTLVVSAQATPVIGSVENAARNEQTLIAPGLFLAIKGTNLGPATAVGGTVTNGAYGTTAGEARVLFDGIAAPITYASATQLNVVAPYSLFGRTSTRVQVENRGVRSDAVEYRVVDIGARTVHAERDRSRPGLDPEPKPDGEHSEQSGSAGRGHRTLCDRRGSASSLADRRHGHDRGRGEPASSGCAGYSEDQRAERRARGYPVRRFRSGHHRRGDADQRAHLANSQYHGTCRGAGGDFGGRRSVAVRCHGRGDSVDLIQFAECKEGARHRAPSSFALT